ncbi:MAG: GAF domain-containing protein, partial [Desulfatirhabdiaceae bacterium]
MENIHTEELGKQFARIKDSLISATRIISGRLNLPDALKETLAAARRLVSAGYGVLICIENGQTTHFMQEGISEAQAVQIDRLLSRTGLREDILLNGKTICIDDISTDTRFTGFPPQHPVITSLLGTPIMHGEEILGLLYLGDKTHGGKFSHLDQEI